MSYRTLSFGALAAASLVAFSLCAAPAAAADLDPALEDAPEVIPQSNVVFGSGWYIRGDLGGTLMPNMHVDTLALPANATQQIPQAPTTTLGTGSRLGYDASLGAGYQFTNFIRGDVIADFHQPLATSSVSGNGNVFCPTGVSYNSTTAAGAVDYTKPTYANGACTGYYQANLKSFDVLVNGYVDLGTWSRITPYIGAGVGLSFGHYQTSGTYYQANGVPYQVTYTDARFGATNTGDYDRSASGTYYNFAFALMAGVSIDVFDHTKLDIGYRYLNLGAIPSVSNKLTFNEVRVGLRYMIDN